MQLGTAALFGLGIRRTTECVSSQNPVVEPGIISKQPFPEASLNTHFCPHAA